VLTVGAGLFFSFGIFLPVAFCGGAVLAPVMVAQDTLLHEHAPAGSRALIFSTKDLLMAAVFACTSFVVGGAVWAMSRFGVTEPYRVALWSVGACLVLTTLGRRRPTAEPIPGE
jgi:hypothetical protein